MSDLREAAQQALEAWDGSDTEWFKRAYTVMDALRAALAQQEDVGLLEYRGNSVAFIHQKMTAYRAGIDAAWDAFSANGMHPDGKTSLADMIAKHTAPPQQPSPEPVARECSDPMCACRGGPCAECEEGQREKETEDLRCSLDFYQRRCEALQSWQSKMRDPERAIVCDILANGFTLDPAFAGNRYTAPPRCPNCASLEAQNNELDRKLAELEREPQTLDDALRITRGMAQAYENGYKAGQAHERERIIQFLREMQRQVGDAHNYYGVAAVRIKEGV